MINGAYFNAAEAQTAVDFFQSLTLTKSTLSGRPEKMRLLPQNKKLVANLYGWRRETGARLIRKVFYAVARKNTKTQTAAAIALKEIIDPYEASPEIYMAAKDREQASMCFDAAVAMIRADEDLSAALIIQPSYKTILNPANGGKIKALSSEGRSKHGSNPSVVIIDEYHVWDEHDRELYDALTTGSGARRDPLLVIITTAGTDENSMCYREYEHAKRVADGSVEDPTYLPIIYELPKEADWTDESLWPLANPALPAGVVSIEFLREEKRKALAMPSEQNKFRRLYLNQWVNASEQWIPLHLWDACRGDVDLEWLSHYPCYGGLDLASTRDLTAFVLVWPIDGRMFVAPWFFIPEADLRERSLRDNVRYDLWVRDGLIEATPGGATDWRAVYACIDRLAQRFDIQSIGFDRWGARDIVSDLMANGLDVQQVGQGFASANAPCKRLEGLVLKAQLVHDGNPVLRWNLDCCTIASDPAGNIKPVKPGGAQSNKRIDGIYALWMALGQAMLAEDSSVGVRSL